MREEVAGSWRTLDNGELHNLYSSPFVRGEIGVTCSSHEVMRYARNSIVVKTECKRFIRSWQDYIKVGFKEIMCNCVDWIEPPEDKVQWRTLMNVVMNRLVP